uniref:Transposase n=1 Tax=Heterorhabditis bacteriophora TaxID=37862 RepID=A0A1I7W6I1_HETBA
MYLYPNNTAAYIGQILNIQLLTKNNSTKDLNRVGSMEEDSKLNRIYSLEEGSIVYADEGIIELADESIPQRAGIFYLPHRGILIIHPSTIWN